MPGKIMFWLIRKLLVRGVTAQANAAIELAIPMADPCFSGRVFVEISEIKAT